MALTDHDVLTLFFNNHILTENLRGRVLSFKTSEPRTLYVRDTPILKKRSNVALFLAHAPLLVMDGGDYVMRDLVDVATFANHRAYKWDVTILPTHNFENAQANVDFLNKIIDERLKRIVAKRNRIHVSLKSVEVIKQAPDAYASFFGLSTSPIEDFDTRIKRLGIEGRFAAFVGRAIAA